MFFTETFAIITYKQSELSKWLELQTYFQTVNNHVPKVVFKKYLSKTFANLNNEALAKTKKTVLYAMKIK